MTEDCDLAPGACGVHAPGLAVDRAPGCGDDAVVLLQPQVSLIDGRTVGVRSLARPHGPVRSVVAGGRDPSSGSPVAPPGPADDRRALDPGTRLHLALGAAARWWPHRAPLPVAVGLTVAELTCPELRRALVTALARHGLPPRALTLEVGVDSLVHGPAREVLGELRAEGVAVSLESPGRTVGSAPALRRVPADELRLGPAFAAEVAVDVRARTVAAYTVAMAHTLGLRVVAEGIGDGAGLGGLAAIGCDAVRGPGIAPVMPVDRFLAWLRARPADRVVGATSGPRRPGTHLGDPETADAGSRT